MKNKSQRHYRKISVRKKNQKAIIRNQKALHLKVKKVVDKL